MYPFWLRRKNFCIKISSLKSEPHLQGNVCFCPCKNLLHGHLPKRDPFRLMPNNYFLLLISASSSRFFRSYLPVILSLSSRPRLSLKRGLHPLPTLGRQNNLYTRTGNYQAWIMNGKAARRPSTSPSLFTIIRTTLSQDETLITMQFS